MHGNKRARELFAPPFNRQLGAELTTGQAYQENVGPNSSMDWLENNNAYYHYKVQEIAAVESFVASGKQATIEVVITEERTLYINGKIDHQNTDFDTRLVRYSLQSENGQWKISAYKTIKLIRKS
jgi:serine/threonine-protein kinase